MVEARRGRLSSAARAALEGHVRDCDACQHEEALDHVLDVALSKMTPEPPPVSSRAGVSSGPGPESAGSARLLAERRGPRASARRRVLLGLLALSGLGLLVVIFPRGYAEPDALLSEAVNDHVRVLSAARPVEVEGSSLDTVSPWLSARLDFAPTNAFGGDAETRLMGASAAYFIDRKAAAFVYARDSHTITVLCFRAETLPWRGGGARHAVTTRGYRTVMWRHGDLGYAVVSDLPEATLLGVAARVDP